MMTKKERAEFDSAIYAAELLAALRWTDKAPGPDIPPPACDDVTEGYVFNVARGAVDQKWSGAHRHGYVQHGLDCAAQGGISLYSTKKKALLAMRNAVEEECARKLRAIDQMIKQEDAK